MIYCNYLRNNISMFTFTLLIKFLLFFSFCNLFLDSIYQNIKQKIHVIIDNKNSFNGINNRMNYRFSLLAKGLDYSNSSSYHSFIDFFRFLFICFLCILGIIQFYHIYEGWSIIDSTFFVASTLSTVGNIILSILFLLLLLILISIFILLFSISLWSSSSYN